MKIKAITHRKNPIVHDMGAWPSVGGLPLVRIPAHAFMNRKIKEAVPDVKRFLFLPEVGWFYGFIQLDKKHAGQPKQAILAAFASELYLKYVAVFDTDIDIENPAQMAWALATQGSGGQRPGDPPGNARNRSRPFGACRGRPDEGRHRCHGKTVSKKSTARGRNS